MRIPATVARSRMLLLTGLALLAFAGNSVLCRLALAHTAIDAASFTSVRLLSGALTLWLLVAWRGGRPLASGDWRSALALFIYAAGFSFAYLSLTAATGALLLFGAVQVGMIGAGLRRGERLRPVQWFGLLLAVGGLVALLLPGIAAPPLAGALLMLGAGFAWAIYSLRGRGGGDPLALTAGNFLRAAPLALLLGAVLPQPAALDAGGIGFALASGVLTSALGYVAWYAVLPNLRATDAATLQLSVPVLAALGGVVLLDEALTLRLLLAAAAILGGIALVLTRATTPGTRSDSRGRGDPR